MDAPIAAGAPRRPSVPLSAAGAALLVAAAVAFAYAVYGTTHPYDPLAGAPSMGTDVADGIQVGVPYTAIVAIGTPKGERPTILGVAAATDMGATLVRVAGLTYARGLTIWPGPARVAAAHASSVSALRPVRGLRFVHGPQWLGTHVWLAVTFRVHERGCIDLPQLRLRYAVGGTAFERVVPLGMKVRTPGTLALCSPTT
jgi:hypothetical protein